MDATQISHIGICVRDMEKSLAFYRDSLGMKVVAEGDTDPTEGARPDNYRHPRRTRRRVSLSFSENPTNPTLTLTNHPGEEPDGQAIYLDQVGISHIAFMVTDPKSLAEELISKGYELAGSWEAFTNSEGQVRSLYMYDPDRILVQFARGAGS